MGRLELGELTHLRHKARACWAPFLPPFILCSYRYRHSHPFINSYQFNHTAGTLCKTWLPKEVRLAPLSRAKAQGSEQWNEMDDAGGSIVYWHSVGEVQKLKNKGSTQLGFQWRNVFYGEVAHDRDPAHPWQPWENQIYIRISQSIIERLPWESTYQCFGTQRIWKSTFYFLVINGYSDILVLRFPSSEINCSFLQAWKNWKTMKNNIIK